MTGEVELLERAAARLDSLLARTTTGRWQVDGPWWHGWADEANATQMVTAGPDRAAVVLGVPDLGTGRDSHPDLAYVAALGPQVGRALVRWLQDTATDTTRAGAVSPWAVALAREILGEEGGGDSVGAG